MTTTFVETLTGEPFVGITFEEGDVQISLSGGVFQNVGTLPATRRPDSAIIDLTFLSATENVVGAEIRFRDQTVPAEWFGETITIEEGETFEAYDDTALLQLINDITTEVGMIKKLGEEIDHERIGGGINNDIVVETRV